LQPFKITSFSIFLIFIFLLPTIGNASKSLHFRFWISIFSLVAIETLQNHFIFDFLKYLISPGKEKAG